MPASLRKLISRVITVAEEELESAVIVRGRPLTDVISFFPFSRTPRIVNLSSRGNPEGVYIPPRPMHLVPPLAYLAQPIGLEVNVYTYMIEGVIVYFVDEPPVDDVTMRLYVFFRQKLGESGETSPGKALEVVKEALADAGVDPDIVIAEPSVKSAIYYAYRDTVGYGPLDIPMIDTYVEEVSWYNYDGPVAVVDKLVQSKYPNTEFVYTNIAFDSTVPDHLKKFYMTQIVRAVTAKARIGLTTARPLGEARIPDPSGLGFHRLASHLDIVSRSAGVTIRKFPQRKISLTELVKWNTVSSLEAAYLLWQLLNRGFILVVGVMASGKTTLLQALISALPATYKVITIEDTPELSTPAPNWHPLYVRRAPRESELEDVTFERLGEHSLRHRGTIVTLGEVRGREMTTLVQAAASVAWDTPVMVRIDGRVVVANIGEVVDAEYGDAPDWTRVKPSRRIEVLTLGEDGRVTWKPVAWMLRHYARRIYRVRYVGGEVKATGSHSVFVFDPATARIVEKPVSELKRGDFLVSFVRPPYMREGEERQYTASRLLTAARLAWMLRLNGSESFVARYGGARGMYIVRSRSPRRVETSIRRSGRIVPRSAVEAAARTPTARRLLRLLAGNRSYVTFEEAMQVVEAARREGARDERLERLEWLLRSEAVLLPVIEVSEEEYEGFVYDFSVPGTEAFFGGVTPVLLHNSGHGAICLPPDTPVAATIDGRPGVYTIKEVVEAREAGRDVKVYAMDPETGAFAWKPVTGTVKVRVDKWVVARTVAGRTLKMTPDHRVLVYEAGGFRFKPASELKPGDRIPVAAAVHPPKRHNLTRIAVCCRVVIPLGDEAGRVLGYILRSGRGRARLPLKLLGFFRRHPLGLRTVVDGDTIELPAAHARKLRQALLAPVVESPITVPAPFARGLGEALAGATLELETPEEAAALSYVLRRAGYESVANGRRLLVMGRVDGHGYVLDTVYRVEVVEEPGDAYDIEVADYHTFTAFDGVVTGNCTFHADSPFTVLARITSPPINISPASLKLITSIVHISKTKTYARGKPESVRRVLNVYEIEDVNVRTNEVKHTVTFKWHPLLDRHHPAATVKGLVELWHRSRVVREMGATIYADEAQRALAEIYAIAKFLEKLVAREVFDIRQVNYMMTSFYVRLDEYVDRLWRRGLGAALSKLIRKTPYTQ